MPERRKVGPQSTLMFASSMTFFHFTVSDFIRLLNLSAREYSDFVFRPLGRPVLQREVCLITRRLRSLSPLSERFLAVLKGLLKDRSLPVGVASLSSD